nr:hypothetical protein [Tanacetum cinerariifolium]
MKSIQTFLEEFNYISFEEKPRILLEAWYTFFTIQHAQPEDSNELFQKHLKDLKELAEYVNYPRPPQDSNIHQLIREECGIKVYEEQKKNTEDTNLELVGISRQKEFLCMHDNEQQEVKNVVEQPAERGTLAPILSTKEPEYSPSMGYKHPNTTSETESHEIIKSGVKELVPILSEKKVTSEDKRECDMPVCENSPVCDDHSEIFSDSNNDDDISSDEDAFEDIEYVEASLPDPEIVSAEEENVVHQEEEEVDLEDISQIQDVILREKLLRINRLIANIESLNDNPTRDCLLNSSILFPISEESDNSLSDNFSPEFETFCDHMEETRSDNTTTHAEADLFLASDNLIPPGIENFADDSERDIHFLEALLIDDSIPFSVSEESDFDNLSFPRPTPEPPDFETDAGEEISVVMNDIAEFESLNPRDEFDDDNYSSFMFLIYLKVFSFLSAQSEDTIFDPGISV